MKTKKLSLRGVRSLLKRRFGGVIKAGKHEKNGECCVHELASAAKGLDWTDKPWAVRLLDLRPLNDVDVPDDLRTEWMVKLLVAYDGSRDWSKQRMASVIRKIVRGVVNELIAELPNLPTEVRQQCRSANTMRKCKSATYATRAYAQGLSYSENPHVVDSACDAVLFASSRRDSRVRAFASAIGTAAGVCDDRVSHVDKAKVFVTACKIWLAAAQESKK